MGVRHPHKPSEYPSFILYLLDKTHLTVTAATTIYVLYQRRAHPLYFGIGAILSSISAKLVKHFIRDPRPPPASSISSPVRPKRTYGMPSTHSTVLTFFLAYLLPQSPTFTHPYIYGTSIAAYWAAGVWSRTKLGYHTWPQCLGGIFFGAALAWGWNSLWIGQPSLEGNIQTLIDLMLSPLGLSN
ncbi:hypothetical protein M231_01947 [Tremella mesenterica]|uniref:Phosphatidic acid phosphatase type 2/haloperoxidase domain-containing protein n=1 Tax=Tremella mesenterica TaxID=5217 RepID=A0A4Q1BRV4_TREME|nr:uncharacterized protein TREMEDRAFT_37326 [Tremella mesenterica DSM 1558]EIW73422.1 hypothetical protein TREMEDRAFT_37326 [Tremella mesenterica DSM 1558]RXK40696.1 hypothetical protein M231_01947 [Tremella mesenterica]